MEIITYPHPTLRHKSKPIKRVDTALREVVREMFKLMYDANGVGLAANQVDLPIRLFVVNLEADPEKGEEMVFINPVISMPKGTEENEEGCLSLPGLTLDVDRFEKVTVEALDPDGQKLEIEAEGLLSIALQHEIDHLDGIFLVDRLSNLRRKLYHKKRMREEEDVAV